MSKDVINRYALDAPFSNENAGFCKWTTAVKDGKKYFLKEFLDPIYPISNKLSNTIKEKRIRECRAYEEKKKNIIQAVNSGGDGNLVRIEEFFRYDSHYYIATELIPDYGVKSEKIVLYFPLPERMFLCMSLAHTAAMFHSKGIVHSDIKPSNILLKRTAENKLVGKIIDFDGCFLKDDPPVYEDELTGDQVYFSPEGCKFIFGESVELSDKLDVFAFGLVFHLYLTGKLPGFNHEKYRYAHESVLDNQDLIISDSLPAEIQRILKKMVLCEPKDRPIMKSVFEVFRTYLFGKSTEEDIKEMPKERTSDSPKKEKAGIRTGKVKINYDYKGKSERKDSEPKSYDTSEYFHSAEDL